MENRLYRSSLSIFGVWWLDTTLVRAERQAAELTRIADEFPESEDIEPGSSHSRITDVEYYSTTAIEQLETLGIPIEQRETVSPHPSQLSEPRQPSDEVKLL